MSTLPGMQPMIPPKIAPPLGVIPTRRRWAWVLEQAGRLKGEARFKVLSVIAYMAMRGTCYPSHTTIAQRTGLSYGGVRKAITDLEQGGLITAHGSGGRRPDGSGIPCVYELNLPPEGQVNLPQEGGVPAPEAGSTCPATGGNLPPGGQQKRDEREVKTVKGSAAPGGAGVSFSLRGMHDLAESLAIREGGEATKQQVQATAHLAKKRHPGLRYVSREVIEQSIARYDRRTCGWAWSDCDQYPPEGTEADKHYACRFKGRKSATGGWDRYQPRPRRGEPMRSAEASAWIQDLQGEVQP